MFGLFNKRIPGPDDERYALIRQIIRHRLREDEAICTDLDRVPVPMLKLTAEAAILFIVEQFLTMYINNAPERLVVKTLNEMHASAFAMGGEYLSVIEAPATLSEYVRHYIDERFADSGPYTDAFLVDAIQMVKSYYRR